MTSKEYLSLHLSLLLAQHGEPSVLEALAPLLGSSPADLHARLVDVRKIGHSRPKKKAEAPKAGASFEALLAEHPEKADVLRKIQARFVARTYLPELKDVRRFLDRHGQPSTSLKKRDEGFARVARQLVHLTLDELQSVLAEQGSSGYSSLGVISDQILGRK
jgi:hypothetical protein